MKCRLCIALPSPTVRNLGVLPTLIVAVTRFVCGSMVATCLRNSQAQEVPAGANAPTIPINPHDRVYHADQVFNTISVYDPSRNTLLGVVGQKVIPNKNSAWFWLLEKPPLGSRKCCAPHRV
jgi:hypothetical protein